MTLNPGEPAEDSDQWVRVITFPAFINPDGTIHHQALKIDQPRPQDQRPWSHEMSGRLLSLTTDLDAEAIAFVRLVREIALRSGKRPAPPFGYYGHMATTPLSIRRVDPAGVDVIYTPVGRAEDVPDDAHSDVAFYRKTAEEIPAIRSRIQDELKIFSPDQTDELEMLRH